MKNNETGRSRGFGFVTFADPENVMRVVENCPHSLDGRTIDPKPCNPRSMHKPKRTGGYPKVFLGGLPANITETDLRNHFQRYGNVMEIVIMFDQEKKKSRGFGFLSFETDEAVDLATADHFVNINGKQVEIKRAEPRDQQNSSMSVDSYQWAATPTMPMGGPAINMGAMGMNQGYQWGGSQPQQNYPGYGANGSNASFQAAGWGGPPQQWGNNYHQQPQQGYAPYDYGTAPNPAAQYGSWNVQTNPGATGAASTAGEMYSRPQSGPNIPLTPTGNVSKPGSDYGSGYGAQYGQNYQYEQQQPQFNNRPRSGYGNGTDSQQSYAAF
jgi:RNA-binding protein Musashi